MYNIQFILVPIIQTMVETLHKWRNNYYIFRDGSAVCHFGPDWHISDFWLTVLCIRLWLPKNPNDLWAIYPQGNKINNFSLKFLRCNISYACFSAVLLFLHFASTKHFICAEWIFAIVPTIRLQSFSWYLWTYSYTGLSVVWLQVK